MQISRLVVILNLSSLAGLLRARTIDGPREPLTKRRKTRGTPENLFAPGACILTRLARRVPAPVFLHLLPIPVVIRFKCPREEWTFQVRV